MQGIHDEQNATKWLEGQIISYLYGGTDENGLNRSVRKVTLAYGVSPKAVKTLFESVEKNLMVYYGGRYRLAYGAIGRRFGEASFMQSHQKSVIMQSLGRVGRALPSSR